MIAVAATPRESVQLRRTLAQSLVAMRGASLRFAPILAGFNETEYTFSGEQIDAALAAMVELEAAMKEVTAALAAT